MLIYTQLQHKESGQWRTVSYSDDDKNLFYEHGNLYPSKEEAYNAWVNGEEYAKTFPKEGEDPVMKELRRENELFANEILNLIGKNNKLIEENKKMLLQIKELRGE